MNYFIRHSANSPKFYLTELPFLRSYPILMPFTHENGYACRCRGAGLARAAYWRALGFPNLVLARKARWKDHVKKSELKRQREGLLEPTATPFALPGRPRGF